MAGIIVVCGTQNTPIQFVSINKFCMVCVGTDSSDSLELGLVEASSVSSRCFLGLRIWIRSAGEAKGEERKFKRGWENLNLSIRLPRSIKRNLQAYSALPR